MKKSIAGSNSGNHIFHLDMELLYNSSPQSYYFFVKMVGFVDKNF